MRTPTAETLQRSPSAALTPPLPAASCSLTQALEVLGERWVFLIVREAFAGATRFSDFRSRLGIAPDVLASRLELLVEGGVMVRQDYRDPGQRTRGAYHLTDEGRDLSLVLGALQQWGDRHRPSGLPRLTFTAPTGGAAAVRFVEPDGSLVSPGDVRVGGDATTVDPEPLA